MSGRMSQPFLDAIVANIDDDAPRLIFADWLEEQGDSDRAEFIRLQVARFRTPAWDGSQVGLRLREQQLLNQHGEAWLAELPVIKGAKWEGFRRGIVAEVSFTSFEAMRSNAHACRAVAPVEAVTVRWPRRQEAKKSVNPIAELRELTLTGDPDYEAFEWVAESPQLSTLRQLTLRSLFGASLETLLASPHLANLRSLRLPSNNLANDAIIALTQSATVKTLEDLDFSSVSRHERYDEDPEIRVSGMNALMTWSGLAQVRSLILSGNNITREGLRTLLRSAHVAALKHLSLRDAALDGQAMAEFGSALPELRLESLDLGDNILKDVGAEYIATAPCLRELKTLRLDRCEITTSGSRLFARKAHFFGGLRQLDVDHNYFGPIGLTALLERAPPLLHTLQMRDNDLFDQGAKLLAESPASNVLLEVDLSENSLGPPAARALSESAHLRELRILRLTDNPIPETAANDLTASSLGQRLTILELDKGRSKPAPRPV